MEGVDVRVDEGAQCTDQATTHVAFAALPDGHTCVGLQLVTASADRLGYLTELKGLHLNVVNDCLNGDARLVRSNSGAWQLVSPPRQDEVLATGSRWLTVDGVLGVRILYGSEELYVDRSVRRRGGRYGSLYVEEVCSSVETSLRASRPGETLIDVGFAVLSGEPRAANGAMEGGSLHLESASARGVWVRGQDGRRYAVVANFGEVDANVSWFGIGEAGADVSIPAGTARVIALTLDLTPVGQ